MGFGMALMKMFVFIVNSNMRNMNMGSMNMSNMKKRGFTFIEVLVVITIISVLMAVGVTNFRIANQKARDGRRKSDLEQIRAALELYRTDQGTYPITAGWPGAGNSLEADGITYMGEIPDDSLEGYDYSYSSDGLSYSLCAALELETSGSCAGGDCGTEDCNYQLTNPL